MQISSGVGTGAHGLQARQVSGQRLKAKSGYQDFLKQEPHAGASLLDQIVDQHDLLEEIDSPEIIQPLEYSDDQSDMDIVENMNSSKGTSLNTNNKTGTHVFLKAKQFRLASRINTNRISEANFS